MCQLNDHGGCSSYVMRGATKVEVSGDRAGYVSIFGYSRSNTSGYASRRMYQ